MAHSCDDWEDGPETAHAALRRWLAVWTGHLSLERVLSAVKDTDGVRWDSLPAAGHDLAQKGKGDDDRDNNARNGEANCCEGDMHDLLVLLICDYETTRVEP